jgi:hypothetical protein
MSGVAKFREVQLQDIVNDPNKFGAPTFKQFCKDPDAWRLRKDHVFLSADRGSTLFDDVRKHNYFLHVDGVPCKARSLEHIEAMCKTEGFKAEDLEMKVFKEVVSGKHEMNVHFRKKPDAK